MKRDKNLQPLSRQHHNGLMVALLLLKGTHRNADLKVMADFILDAWHKELKQHFIMEEKILIPALSQKSFDHKLTDRLLTEHEKLRSIMEKIQQGNFTVADINRFAQSLEQHIRFE